MEDMKKLFQTNKKHCLAFFKISDSFNAVALALQNFFSGQKHSVFYHGPILEVTNGFAT